VEKKRIGVFVPLAFPFGLVPQEFFLSFFRTNEYLLSHADELGYEATFQLFSPTTFPVDANRNHCVALMFENNIDISIWLDADQELYEDTLFRLLKFGNDYPIYAGIYYLKVAPHHPIVFKAKEGFEVFHPIWRFPKEDLFYADMIGMGCVKINKEVFEKTDAPWFAYAPIPLEISKMSDNMKMKRDYQIHDVSEDVYFWRQVKEKTGYRIVIDPQIQVGHITKKIIKPKEVLEMSEINKEITRKRLGKDFEKMWEEQVCKAELVNPNGKVKWVL